MNANLLYRWFMLYQRTIKDDRAKFDLLAMVRQSIPLHQEHEEFYFKHCEKYKSPYIMYGFTKKEATSSNKTVKLDSDKQPQGENQQ